ncbi:MAG: Mbeg1-like protein [Pseudomonadota bacterium]
MSKEEKSVQLTNHWLLATFAYLSYDNIINYDKHGWRNFKSFKNEKSGFFGTTFVNSDLEVIVVAFRGTDDSHDWRSNRCFLTSCIPSQYYDAKDFVNDSLERYKGFKAILVGHSLGGALAQLVAISMNLFAVTFDAPGTLGPAQKLFNGTNISQHKKNILAYVSPYNLVNTCGEQLVSELIQLTDKSLFSSCSESYIFSTSSGHSMKKIRDCFNEHTGEPDATKLISQEGLLSGYNAFKKICEDKRWEEIINLHNCTTLLLNADAKALLRQKITFTTNMFKVEKSFPFLKEGVYCNQEYDSKLISSKSYQAMLDIRISSELSDINTDVSPGIFKSSKSKFIKELNNNDRLVDVYTVSIEWYMYDIENLSYFHEANHQRLCNKYECEYIGTIHHEL